ncbi:Rossmann-fold NAD(P)-binding domain-containing protein [Kangiella koreensis]|uniref:Adenosylhomocysteinase n=1 Tax=Kangiella koreensis (strain DSM 16069 / JCM 12317 / KCTC 12182 / SW-125) TaxID=523791 RepID=C7R5W3_KANKD|nr:adenosylhomocysteinase [Kangiella koreensis]ACV27287.1 adenosylhomocysteinase [Kangiella koreensis DSM 16069]
MNSFDDFFAHYPPEVAPFLHQMLADYQATQPYKGFSIVHNVPLTQTTLLKIACLKAAGADLIVTNPSFMNEDQDAIQILENEKVSYVPLEQVKGEFDFLLDCGAELVDSCYARKGIVELTRTGAMRYQQHKEFHVPIVSVDDTRLKCLETCLGTGEGVYRAITQIANIDLTNKNILIFGYGKVGIGIAYYFSKITPNIIIAEADRERLTLIEHRGHQSVDAKQSQLIEHAAEASDLIITATGLKDIISDNYHTGAFKDKLLANAGAEDEFGFAFEASEVLADKKPVNFILKEPTLMEFLDPIFYAHNIAIDDALSNKKTGFRALDSKTDQAIVSQWAEHHDWTLDQLNAIF